MAKARAMPHSPEIFFSRLARKLESHARRIDLNDPVALEKRIHEITTYYQKGMANFENRSEPFFRDRGIAERHTLTSAITSVAGTTNLVALRLTRKADLRDSKQTALAYTQHAAKLSRALAQLLSEKPLEKQRKQQIKIKKVLEEISALQTHSLNASNIELELQTGRGLGRINSHLMYWAISELISNSKKALLRKEGDKKITLRNYSTGEGHVIEVEDNGIGIPADHLPRIFNGFSGFQARGIAGSGTILPRIKQVIEAHGGTIQVDSQEGRGTKIRILLPRERKQT